MKTIVRTIYIVCFYAIIISFLYFWGYRGDNLDDAVAGTLFLGLPAGLIIGLVLGIGAWAFKED